MKITLPTSILSIFTSAFIISGCSGISDSADNTIKYCADDTGEFYECKDIALETDEVVKSSKDTLFSSQYNFQFLNEYTEQLAYDLKQSLKHKKLSGNIVVTTFVFLDDTLKNTDVIGQQISELLKSDLQNNNLPVAELNLTGYININSKGEFALSRDGDEISTNIDIGYICTGTLIENKQGLLINTKIINRLTNKVEASANKILPRLMIDNTRNLSS